MKDLHKAVSGSKTNMVPWAGFLCSPHSLLLRLSMNPSLQLHPVAASQSINLTNAAAFKNSVTVRNK